jgi:hypothetical protein
MDESGISEDIEARKWKEIAEMFFKFQRGGDPEPLAAFLRGNHGQSENLAFILNNLANMIAPKSDFPHFVLEVKETNIQTKRDARRKLRRDAIAAYSHERLKGFNSHEAAENAGKHLGISDRALFKRKANKVGNSTLDKIDEREGKLLAEAAHLGTTPEELWETKKTEQIREQIKNEMIAMVASNVGIAPDEIPPDSAKKIESAVDGIIAELQIKTIS